MHLTLHKISDGGNRPIFVCANDVQVVEPTGLGSTVRLIGGTVIEDVTESTMEILEFLMRILPERWE